MKCPNCDHEFVVTKPRRRRTLTRDETVAKQRGCWVTADKIADWKTLKSAGYSNEEARESLGLAKYEPTGRRGRQRQPSAP